MVETKQTPVWMADYIKKIAYPFFQAGKEK